VCWADSTTALAPFCWHLDLAGVRMDNRSFNTRKRLFMWSPVLLASTAFVCTGLSLWMLYGSFRQQHERLLTHELVGQLRLLETIGGSNNWDREETLKAFVESNANHPDLAKPASSRLHTGRGIGCISSVRSIPKPRFPWTRPLPNRCERH